MSRNPDPEKANRAISLLAEWARNRTSVEFLDSRSHLRYPGVLASSEKLKTFTFFGYAGISAPITPTSWTRVEIREAGGYKAIYTESEHGEGYTIRRDRVHKSTEDEVKVVREQFSKWKEQGTKLSVFLTHACYALAFSGKVSNIVDVSCFLEHDTTPGELLVVSLNDVICSIETEPARMVVLAHVPTAVEVYISEAAFSPDDLFAQFPLRSAEIQ